MKEWIKWLQVQIPELKEKQNEFLIEQAMRESADEQSIAFAEWKYKINFHENESCYDIKNSPTLTDDWWTIKSTPELLQIFKNETK